MICVLAGVFRYLFITCQNEITIKWVILLPTLASTMYLHSEVETIEHLELIKDVSTCKERERFVLHARKWAIYSTFCMQEMTNYSPYHVEKGDVLWDRERNSERAKEKDYMLPTFIQVWPLKLRNINYLYDTFLSPDYQNLLTSLFFSILVHTIYNAHYR